MHVTKNTKVKYNIVIPINTIEHNLKHSNPFILFMCATNNKIAVIII